MKQSREPPGKEYVMFDHTSFFVTGTDTDIGKTYVARLLADCFSHDHTTTYMKPVQTGCPVEPTGILRAPDFDMVMAGGAVMNGKYEQHVPYRYQPACSPHLAAAMAGETISLDHIAECFEKVSSGMAVTIVEGAGGILAPLSETTFTIDLIAHLNLPVLLVTAPRLGTLNHTFLTLRVLRECGVRVVGIVINNADNAPQSFILEENHRMIQAHTHPIPMLSLSFDNCDSQRLKDFSDAITRQF